MLCRLNVLCLLPLLISAQNVASGQPPQQYACNMEIAEECFSQLFDQMPICSASEESAELAFRCVHYNVLDACFARPTEPRIKCAPKQIGQAARMAYGKRVDFCLFTSREQQQKQQQQQQHSSDKSAERHQQQQHRRHNHHRQGAGGIHRNPSGASIGLLAPPTELQFISLFGYLQIQCRPPIHRKSLEGTITKKYIFLALCIHCISVKFKYFVKFNFSSKRQQQPAITKFARQRRGYASGGQGNCSASELNEISTLCEDEIRQRQPPPHFVLERHRLLRVKLDASSKLLQFPETRPEDECLMVRSVLSDIYLIHQKYCFHATVTKCMCERLKFERTCGIQCANLEPFGLPLNRELSWNDFRGRLNGAPRTRSQPQGMPYIVMLILTMIVSVAYVNRVGP